MEKVVALVTEVELYPNLGLIEGSLNTKNRLIEYLASFISEVGLSEDNTLPYPKTAFPSTQTGLETIVHTFHAKKKYRFWNELDWLELQDWIILPVETESDTIEIQIDSESSEFDLSLLDDKERKFIQDFVGAFDPGPNFTEDDLITDDIY